jgi:8-oxo-dGTP diphosphatase
MREQWELPAGQREEGETSKACAIRELYEETGQMIDDMKFIGLLKLKNLSNGQDKYNPVYFASLDRLQPFVINNETSKIMLWDLKEAIGFVDEIDIQVLKFIK